MYGRYRAPKVFLQLVPESESPPTPTPLYLDTVPIWTHIYIYTHSLSLCISIYIIMHAYIMYLLTSSFLLSVLSCQSSSLFLCASWEWSQRVDNKTFDVVHVLVYFPSTCEKSHMFLAVVGGVGWGKVFWGRDASVKPVQPCHMHHHRHDFCSYRLGHYFLTYRLGPPFFFLEAGATILYLEAQAIIFLPTRWCHHLLT